MVRNFQQIFKYVKAKYFIVHLYFEVVGGVHPPPDWP